MKLKHNSLVDFIFYIAFDVSRPVFDLFFPFGIEAYISLFSEFKSKAAHALLIRRE